MLALIISTSAAAALQGAAAKNSALVFLKPHAANDACEKFVRSQLESAGVQVLQSGVRAGGEIAELKLIDQHYGSLGERCDSNSCEFRAHPAAAAAVHRPLPSSDPLWVRPLPAAARLAMETEPSAIALSPAARTAFAEAYGCEWEEALPSSASKGLDPPTSQVTLQPSTLLSC